jgi:hypothetical protein
MNELIGAFLSNQKASVSNALQTRKEARCVKITIFQKEMKWSPLKAYARPDWFCVAYFY